MIKRLTTIVILALLLVSCFKYDEPDKPEHLISKKDMARILIDLRLIKSANGNNKKVLDSHFIEASSYIYKKYNIDSLQFALSNNYYAFHVAQYEEIYTHMKDTLTKLKAGYKEDLEIINKAKRLADSIKRADMKALKEKKSILKKDATLGVKPALNN